MIPKEMMRSVRDYASPDNRRAIVQILNTVVPYLLLWVGMALTLTHGYPLWTTLLLLAPAVFLHVRMFILFHDCCHLSFFSNVRMNRIAGFILGVVTFTPYGAWSQEHLRHHQTVADLERRGVGDIWTLTVREYQDASRGKRLLYRLVRHPLVLFGLGPVWLFAVSNRCLLKGTSKEGRRSVWTTNLGIALMVTILGVALGWRHYLLILIPVVYLSGVMGIWLFYVQHQFDATHWYPRREWDFVNASLYGSSYYKLPQVLQWLTGNIGLHHVHHINARIPNYNLQACYDGTVALQDVPPVTLRKSFGAARLKLWDEEREKLISFADVPKRDA